MLSFHMLNAFIFLTKLVGFLIARFPDIYVVRFSLLRDTHITKLCFHIIIENQVCVTFI